MNIRHLKTSTFDGVIEESKSVVYDGVPICISVNHQGLNSHGSSRLDEALIAPELQQSKSELINGFLGEVLSKDNEILPLSDIFNFEVKEGSKLAEFLPVGCNFDMILNDENTKEYLADLASNKMFQHINPLTNKKDVEQDSFYESLVPLVTYSGVVPPQLGDDGVAYFNPLGTVTIAEFLDSLNALKFGCNGATKRKKSLDNVSEEQDYFNEGYNSCIKGYSSPFFNLYTREELTKPITRLELAYITVVCWIDFTVRFNTLCGGSYYLGVSFDWNNPNKEFMHRFSDMMMYQISKHVLNIRYDVVSLNIADYKEADKTMTQFKQDIKDGVSAFPVPMYMSLLELCNLGLFYFENDTLDPLKEVSRAELCYFSVKLSSIFKSASSRGVNYYV